MSATYVELLRRPGAARFVTAGFIGRLPIAMVSLGIVLMVTAHGGSYALAGAMSASYALAAAFIAPFGARWIDRSGQARVVPVLLAGQIACLLAFTWAASSSAPIPLQFVLLIAAGGVGPNLGSLIRARWAALLTGSSSLRSAFALEAVVDEMVFVIGPPLVTTLAVQINEAVALVVCCVLFTIGGLWLASQRRTQPAVHERAHSDHDTRLVSPGMVIVTFVLLLMGGIFGSFEVTTVAFTKDLGHEESTGIVLALYAFGSLLSGLVLGSVRLTADLPRQLLWFSLLLAVVTIPVPLVQHIIPLMAVALLAGMSVSPVLITTVTMVEHLVPATRLTEALTIATSGIAVGLAIGSTASGALVDTLGANGGYYVMAGCAVAAFAVSLVTMSFMSRTSLSQT